MNLVEILKNVPKGTKLYSPLFGEVTFNCIQKDEDWPVVIKTDENKDAYFAENGKYNQHVDCECMLFPSKENRDWSTFTIIKPGDIIFSEGLLYLMKNHNTVIFCYDTIRDIAGYGYKCEIFKNYTFANKEQKEKLFYELEKRGFKYNPIDVSIETIENENKTSYKFKPFDKVLVRNEDNELWNIQFFGYYDESAKDVAPYICLGNSTCIADTFKQCIPFEGNEKLLGHYDNV